MTLARSTAAGRILVLWTTVLALVFSVGATAEQVIDRGDALSILVLRHPELSVQETVVTDDGNIYLPVVGELHVAGMTVPRATEEVTRRLRERLVHPEVTISFIRVKPDNVYVLGTVMFLYGNYKIEPRDDADIAVNPVGVDDPVASKVGLAQNMPNPFNPKTTIAFTLPTPQDVTIDVFDIAGRRVVTLIDDSLGAGQHFVEWTGRDADGKKVASGIYFYRMNVGDQEFSKKMVLLK